jgi:hypothetical protein
VIFGYGTSAGIGRRHGSKPSVPVTSMYRSMNHAFMRHRATTGIGGGGIDTWEYRTTVTCHHDEEHTQAVYNVDDDKNWIIDRENLLSIKCVDNSRKSRNTNLSRCYQNPSTTDNGARWTGVTDALKAGDKRDNKERVVEKKSAKASRDDDRKRPRFQNGRLSCPDDSFRGSCRAFTDILT